LETLESTLSRNNVYLSRPELQSLAQSFKSKEGNVDYHSMSHALGLHSNKVQMIKPSTASCVSWGDSRRPVQPRRATEQSIQSSQRRPI